MSPKLGVDCGKFGVDLTNPNKEFLFSIDDDVVLELSSLNIDVELIPTVDAEEFDFWLFISLGFRGSPPANKAPKLSFTVAGFDSTGLFGIADTDGVFWLLLVSSFP